MTIEISGQQMVLVSHLIFYLFIYIKTSENGNLCLKKSCFKWHSSIPGKTNHFICTYQTFTNSIHQQCIVPNLYIKKHCGICYSYKTQTNKFGCFHSLNNSEFKILKIRFLCILEQAIKLMKFWFINKLQLGDMYCNKKSKIFFF